MLFDYNQKKIMKNKSISIREFAMWIITMLFVIFLSVWVKHMLHWIWPDYFWVDYRWWVVLLWEQYVRWEPMKYLSDSIWRNTVDVRWEDTPYWKNTKWTIRVWLTQYRPEEQALRRIRPEALDPSSARPYSLGVPDDAVEVKMCWNVIGYTTLGYEKTDSYCTEWYPIVG